MKTYMCWRCLGKRLAEKELVKRKEDSNHIDYCCPYCESVIICERGA
jgi:DNA-directed RNA polymerase subunit RPC12/RpoP